MNLAAEQNTYCNSTVIKAINSKAVFPQPWEIQSSFPLAQVIYLRRLKSLQTLNLSGNPFCREEHYRLFVVAHLPSLVYLDFKLVRKSTVRFLHSLIGKSGKSILQSLCFVGVPAIFQHWGQVPCRNQAHRNTQCLFCFHITAVNL